MKQVRPLAQGIAVSLCLIAAVIVVVFRTTGQPHETQYGRYLHRFERTIDSKRVFQTNPRPDLIAEAYRRTVGAGEARITTHGTDSENAGSTTYAGTGVVLLSEGSSEATTKISGRSSAITRIVRNDLYIYRTRNGSKGWVGLPRNFGPPQNFPAENFTVPLLSLQYLSTLHTVVRRGTVTGPGIAPCQGYLTDADEHGGTHSLLTTIGVCLDFAGRISVASFSYAHSDQFHDTHEAFDVTLSGYGVNQSIVAPTGARNPFKS